jgi:small subunit ribosomal protein S7
MPRKYQSTERFMKPDPKFGSMIVAKFINCLMLDGKKSIARDVFYDAMEIVAKKVADKEPIDVFLNAIGNLRPVIEVRSKRVGGATYQVPIEVTRRRQQSLSFRWMLEAVRTKKGKPMAFFLAEEIMAADRREGAAMTKRENTHKMADANKMNAHFAW